MITRKEQLRDALAGLCADVICGYPKVYTAGSLLCWRESGNARFAQADGQEYLAELEYTLDIFAPSIEEAHAMHASADERMLGMGFRRESSAEIYEQNPAVCHISARYRALADAAGNNYQ